MDKQDWVGITKLPATVDHFLAATLHLRVVALYGSEVEVGIRLTRRHGRRRAAAKTDVHCRAAENDQLRTNVDLAFLYVIGTNVADPARQHDRFVITAQLFAIVAVHFFFISTEVAVQCRTTKFVVKCRATQRAFVVSKVAAHFRPFHDGGVIFISRENVIRRSFEGVFDHLKQRFRLLFTIDNPVGVKNFVAAVLGVRLREHIQLDVVRVTTQLCERILQIVNFIFRQCQAKTQVSVD